MTKLNQLLVNDFPSGKFVTMVYGVLDPTRRSVVFATAGHLPPLFIDKHGEHFLEVERGLPLGLTSGDDSETKISVTPPIAVGVLQRGHYRSCELEGRGIPFVPAC